MIATKTTSAVFIVSTCVLVHICPSVSATDFLGVTLATASEIASDIHFALSGRHDLEHRSLSSIQQSLSSGFHALPKNDQGLLERPALYHLVHRFFIKEYGWFIKGLHTNGSSRQTDSNEAKGVALESLPGFIEQFLEKRHAGGFSLQDAAVMISTLDHVMLNEHIALLQGAYQLRGFDQAESHSMEDIDDVIISYRLLYIVGNVTSPEKHMKLLKKIEEVVPTWIDGKMFFSDAMKSYFVSQGHKASPFTEPKFTFGEIWSALSEAMRLFGAFEDIECHEMKNKLLDMDPSMSGRVPLGRFYRSEDHFSESVDYLRSLGALDESGSGDPQLLLSNYMLSATNCAKDGPYYQVCCRSECELLMDKLEDSIVAPTATAEVILSLVQALPSSTVTTSRNLSEPLMSALWQMSDFHGGEIPLHGRLFGQWMHYAYPYECPYPHTSSTSLSPLQQLEFQQQTGLQWGVSEEVKAHYLGQATAESHVLPHMSQWILEEELHFGGAPRRTTKKVTAWMSQAAIIVSFAVAIWKSSARLQQIIWQGPGDKDTGILV